METNVFAPPGPATIELGSLAPETIPAQEATELLSQMLAEPGVGGLFQYQHYPVARHQEAGALFLAKLGLAVPPAQVQFAGGGQNALAAILAGLFAPGDKIGTSPLVYPGLKSAAKLLGIHLVPLRERQGELCEEGLRYAIDNEGIRAIYVMPDLHNPTNHNMSPACRAMFCDEKKYFLQFVALRAAAGRGIKCAPPAQTTTGNWWPIRPAGSRCVPATCRRAAAQCCHDR